MSIIIIYSHQSWVKIIFLLGIIDYKIQHFQAENLFRNHSEEFFEI